MEPGDKVRCLAAAEKATVVEVGVDRDVDVDGDVFRFPEKGGVYDDEWVVIEYDSGGKAVTTSPSMVSEL